MLAGTARPTFIARVLAVCLPSMSATISRSVAMCEQLVEVTFEYMTTPIAVTVEQMEATSS
jgi:hypothetical protein